MRSGPHPPLNQLAWNPALPLLREHLFLAVEGGELTAAVTRDAVEDLGLFPGSAVVALVKSTEVSLATG